MTLAANMTPSARDASKFCGARKRQGEGTCRRPSGWGTNHLGYGRCKLHGGTTPSGKVSAEREEVRARLRLYAGERALIDPVTALLEELHRTAGIVRSFEDYLAGMDDEDPTRAGIVEIYRQEREALRKVSKAAIDAGVSERYVRLAERMGDQITNLLNAVFGDPDLAMTPGQRQLVPQLVRKHMAALPAAGQTSPTP